MKHQMARFLATLYWKSWKARKFPKALKKAFTVEIHKGGEKHLAKNHRPISLTSYISKALERKVRMDIVEYLDKN